MVRNNPSKALRFSSTEKSILESVSMEMSQRYQRQGTSKRSVPIHKWRPFIQTTRHFLSMYNQFGNNTLVSTIAERFSVAHAAPYFDSRVFAHRFPAIASSLGNLKRDLPIQRSEAIATYINRVNTFTPDARTEERIALALIPLQNLGIQIEDTGEKSATGFPVVQLGRHMIQLVLEPNTQQYEMSDWPSPYALTTFDW